MRGLLAFCIFFLQAAFLFGQAPKIIVSTDSFNEDLDFGDHTEVELTITNEGNRDLNWEMNFSSSPVYFKKDDWADYTKPENQDRIIDDVWITRQDRRGLYNAALQESFGEWESGSPLGTLWAAGQTSHPSFTYRTFMDMCKAVTSASPFGYSCYMPIFTTEWFKENYGKLSLQLEEAGLYFDIDMETWSIGEEGGSGGFSYTRHNAAPLFLPSAWSGSLPVGGSENLDIIIDAGVLNEGLYHSTLTIVSDDPDTPEKEIYFTISIKGEPEISVNADEIDFGLKPISGNYTFALIIENSGNGPLEISEISFETASFSADLSEFEIGSGRSQKVNITFSPDEIGVFQDVMTIYHNDPNFVPIEVSILGEGVPAPGIEISLQSISEELEYGQYSTHEIIIENSGDYELEWELRLSDIPSKVTFTKEDYAEYNSPGNFDIISSSVAIARKVNEGIFNDFKESKYSSSSSPSGTLWAFGYTKDLNPQDYKVWRDAVNSEPPSMVGRPMSMYLEDENSYIDIMFTQWTSGGNGGGFSYIRDDFPAWLSFNDNSGVVGVGENLTLEIDLFTDYVSAGEYEAFIEILSNDPQKSVITIPVSLIVTGTPEIDGITEFDFEGIFSNETKVVEIEIENKGSDVLQISTVYTESASFTVLDYPESVDGFRSGKIKLSFKNEIAGVYEDVLHIESNDPNNAIFSIDLLGEVLLPPIIQTDKTSISITLAHGDNTSDEVVIENVGNNLLEWELDIFIDEFIEFSKAPYANHNEAENQDRISDDIWITRASSQGIFNIKTENSFESNVSPAGTLWAFGKTLTNEAFDYENWRDAVGSNPPSQVGNVVSLFLIDENRYFDLLFSQWSEGGNGGGFAYSRIEVPSWIRVDQIDGVLDEEENITLTFNFNTNALNAGVYNSKIVISSNDFDHETVEIPVTLTVTGSPEIYTDTDLIEFDPVETGKETVKEFFIENIGSNELEIISISNSLDVFSVIDYPESIMPGEKAKIELVFSPTEAGQYVDELEIESNDSTNPLITINLKGESQGPSISVNLEKIETSLFKGETISITLLIENIGSLGSIDWDVGGERVSFIKEDLSDWTLPENQDRISDEVWIARKNTQGLFNAALEDGYGSSSPAGTLWAFGNTVDLEPIDYEQWADAVNSNPSSMVGNVISLLLESENKYYDLMFHSYSGGGPGGGFSYSREFILPEWLTFDIKDGSLDEGETVVVEITIDGTGMSGSYTTNFVVHSNDPVRQKIFIPLSVEFVEALVLNPLDDIRVDPGFETETIDISDVFYFSESDDYTISIASSKKSVATVELEDDNLIISEVGTGNTIITLRADNGKGVVIYDDFLFIVNAPPHVENPISDIILTEGFGTYEIELGELFGDINNDVLSLSVVSESTDVVTVSLENTLATITEVALGTSVITVTADDGYSGSISSSFTVEVEPFTNIQQPVVRGMSVWPNPSKGIVNIDLTDVQGEIIVSLIDISGRIISTKQYNNQGNTIVVNYSFVLKGIYFLRVSDSDGVIAVRKIIIE